MQELLRSINETKEYMKGLSRHLGPGTTLYLLTGPHGGPRGRNIHRWGCLLCTLSPSPVTKSERGCIAWPLLPTPHLGAKGPLPLLPPSPRMSAGNPLKPKHETGKQMQNWFLPQLGDGLRAKREAESGSPNEKAGPRAERRKQRRGVERQED